MKSSRNAARFRGSGAADASPDRASGDVNAGFRTLRIPKGSLKKILMAPCRASVPLPFPMLLHMRVVTRDCLRTPTPHGAPMLSHYRVGTARANSLHSADSV